MASGYALHRSSSQPMVAWSSGSPLKRTYSFQDIADYTRGSDYYRQRWSTAYNPFHKNGSYYARYPFYWPLHRGSSRFANVLTRKWHADSRYYYESPYYSGTPAFRPNWDFTAGCRGNYYTYLAETGRMHWRGWPWRGYAGQTYRYGTLYN